MSTPDKPFPAAHTQAMRDTRWFVLHTRSRQEKALAAALAQMRVEHYLPLVERTTYTGRRKRRSRVPLFPGYVFVHGTIEQAYDADRTKRVARVIDPANQAQLHDELANIRLALECGAALTPTDRLSPGVRVEVIAGPFKGVVGTVEQSAGRERLILGVASLGRGASLEIDASLLQPV